MKYPTKIIVAWGEAISGNVKIREWLLNNGFPELAVFTFALRNKTEARNWLMEHKFPHLMALIRGIEGEEGARKWLLQHNFKLLFLMALAADNDEIAMKKLRDLPEKEWALIAERMQIVKNNIERDNNDIHQISTD